MGFKRKRGAKDDSAAKAKAQKRSKNASNIVPILAAPKPDLSNVAFVEIPTIDERKHEGAVYDLLGSENENDRIEAADCIVSGLLGGDGVPEAALLRHLDRRLFRGLSSGRNASRIGFSLVITEILSQLFGGGGGASAASSRYPDLTFETVLSFLTEKRKVVGNVAGQEERDIFFGQLFGLECFVKSRILFAEPARWDAILAELLRLGNKKVWLRSQCGWVLVQALEQMDRRLAKSLLEKLADAGLAKTPEGVATWLVALDRFPDLKVKPWINPLASKAHGDLAAVLRESFNEAGKDDAAAPSMSAGPRKNKNKNQASWSAQLHFVWDIILGHYAKAGEGEAGNADDFSLFWSRVIDEGLFSKQATDGQKFKGFMVFQTMLEGLAGQPRKLQALFSKNLLQCLMNQASRDDRFLHRAAIKALKAIEAVASSRSETLVPILDSLLGKDGAYNFDTRSCTKTIDRLLQNFGPSNEKGVLKVLQRAIPSLAQQEDVEDAQAILRAYIEYLSKVLAASTGHKSEGHSRANLGFALQELSRLGFSSPKDISKKVLTERIRDFARVRLESALGKLTRQADDFATFCDAVASIDPSSMTLSDEIKTAIEGALARMRKFLKSKSKSKSKSESLTAADEDALNEGLAMLHAISIFQLYNEDPDAMDVLDDLAQFHDRLKKKRETGGGEDEGSSEFLVEILLSMVSRPSSLLRHVSQRVFEAFTGQISAGGLELLTGPLEAAENTQGQKALFDTENDGMDVDEGGSDENDDDDDDDDDDVVDVEDASDFELDSDLEFVGLDADADSEAEEEDDDAESENENDDDDDDEEKEQEGEGENENEAKEKKQAPLNLEDLDDLVGSILKSHRLDKDAAASSSDSDGDMSDSEMLALDSKLAEVFKHRVQSRPDSKRAKKDAKQSVINFKHRILDFLDIYVKNEALNPLAFEVLLPLMRLVRTTGTKALAGRACGIIVTYQKGFHKARGGGGKDEKDGEKDGEKDEEKDEGLLKMLVEVHEEAGRDNGHVYAKAASAASLILASALFAADKEAVGDVAGVYARTQSEWVLGKARLQSSFFTDWNNWCQNQASKS